MSTDGPQTSVLVVDDEEKITRAHERWLNDEYCVTTANSGEEALGVLDSDIDVVVLDRMMPGMDGDEVVEAIRSDPAVQDCLVIMVTAVDPDFDIVELGFDDYLIKPASESKLKETIENVLEQRGKGYDENVRKLYSLSSKRAVLAEHKTDHELETSDKTGEIDEQIQELRAAVTDIPQSVPHDDNSYDEVP